MNRILLIRIVFPMLVFSLLTACNKDENRYVFIWDQTFGPGSALDVAMAADSGIVVCGTSSGNPFLKKITRGKVVRVDYTMERAGSFTSCWSDTASFVVAGSSQGSLLLAKIDKMGELVWDTLIDASFYIDVASMARKNDDTFVVVGSARVDSLRDGVSGLLFVEFDIDGNFAFTKELVETTSIFAEGMAMDGNGNIYLPMTRRWGDDNPTAGAAKFSAELHKIWESELYNNPNYGAASMDIEYDDGMLYMTGRTETLRKEEVVNNSFVVALNPSSGVDIWKSYRENSNTGVDVTMVPDLGLLVLNKNCFVASLADPVDGTDLGKIRMFNGCDSYSTTEIGASVKVYYDQSLLIGGARGGSIFVALKGTDLIDEF